MEENYHKAINGLRFLKINKYICAAAIWTLSNQLFAQAPNISYPASQKYIIGKAIVPMSPTNTGGAVPAKAFGQVTTFAGSGPVNYADGTGTAASFYYPNGLATDATGNVYVADQYNNRIRKISPDGVVTTLAGSGKYGSTNGIGTSASFKEPVSVALDVTGNIYVVDYGSSQIRKISRDGVVSTFAGEGTAGYADGASSEALFNFPTGVATDAAGNVYVADRGNNCIRRISPDGLVTTLAGSETAGYADGVGIAASFNKPNDLATDADGNVYVADGGNYRIRKITPDGVVTTLAGNGIYGYADGLGTAASFYFPNGITTDAAGNVFVADQASNRIRKITPSGMVSTLAGSGAFAYADGQGIAASFNNPISVTSDASGNLFVADSYNQRI